MKTESHTHSLENFNVVVDFKSVVEGEQILLLIARYGTVNHSLLAGIDYQERQLNSRTTGRAAMKALVLFVSLNLCV